MPSHLVGEMADRYGDPIAFRTAGGSIFILFEDHSDTVQMELTPELREEFAQLLVAASHRAEGDGCG